MDKAAQGGATNNWFSWLKYLTYALLTVNVFLFLQEELLAAEHTFTHEWGWRWSCDA